MKIWKRKWLSILSISTLILIPQIAFSCSPKPAIPNTNETPSQKQVKETTFFFYEALFNSSYWQQLLLDNKFSEITQEQVVNLAKNHPLINNFAIETQNLIKQELNNLYLTSENQEKEIHLEFANFNFDYQLKNFDNASLNAYDFNQSTKQVKVDLNKMHSFYDIFNVFSDIWNIKAKYNNLNLNPYTKIYDYYTLNNKQNIPSLAYLTKHAKVNNILSDIFAWNFDYEINFYQDLEHNYLFKVGDYQKNYQFITDFAAPYKENFDPEKWVEQISSDYQREFSNYSIYPIFNFAQNEKQNEVLNTYAILPLTTYKYLDQIWAKLFKDFAIFTRSDIFTKQITNNFAKEIEIYQYDETLNKIIKKQLNDVKYNEKPEFLVDKALNLENLTFLQWMFAQFLFNSQYYDFYQNIAIDKEKLTEMTASSTKKEIWVADLNSENFLINEKVISKIDNFNSDLERLKIKIPLEAKYGFAFDNKQVLNFPFALKKENKNSNNFILDFAQKEVDITDDILKPTLKIEQNSNDFFDNSKNFDEMVKFNFNEEITNLMTQKIININQIGSPSFVKKPLSLEQILQKLQTNDDIVNFSWTGQEKFALELTKNNYFFLKEFSEQNYYYQKLNFELVYNFDSSVLKNYVGQIEYKTTVEITFQTY